MVTERIIAASCQCFKLRSAARKITRMYDDALRPAGIKANQLSILIGVSLMTPVSITQLADALSMDRTTLSRNLAPLEKGGLIKLQAGQGRVRNAIITDEGKGVIKVATPAWQTVQTQFTKLIGTENIVVLNDLLKLVRHNS
jgi:DNA-binding MarR family transcriptional regulator